MAGDHPAKGAAATEWRSGWRLVLCASISVMLVGMHFPALGALLRPLTTAYGWGREQAALGLTLASLAAPLASIVAGAAAERFGLRRTAITGMVLFAPGYALFALAGPALWSWYLVSVVFAVLSQLTGPVVWTMAVVRHFRASRGLALAIIMSGAGIMTSLMPSLVLMLVGTVGARAVFLVLAAAAAVLLLGGGLVLFRGHTQTPEVSAQSGRADGELPGLTVSEALSATRFWRLGLALLLVSATVGMFVLHFQSMLVDSGMTPMQAAAGALAIGPMMIAGRLATGILFDRLEPTLVAGSAFAVLGLGCQLMLGFPGGLAAAVQIAAIIGLGVGAEVDVVSYLTSRYFGVRHYGVLFALQMGIYSVGIGLGSALAGRIFDRFGSYDPALIGLGLGCALAAGLAITLGRPPVLAASTSD